MPERRLSGQLYPFFRRNQNVAAGGAYFWDERGDQLWNCVYAKNFWHLPLAKDARLSDLALPSGLRVRCLEPLAKYAIGYDDPDAGDEVHLDLTFTAVTKPHYLGHGHFDQPGRYQGTLVLHGETIRVDGFGFRDRSWGVRSQFGPGLTSTPAKCGGYSYATASERDGFHTITLDFGQGCNSIHGYLLRDGVWSRLASGRREVVERDRATGYPLRVAIDGVERDRTRTYRSGRAEHTQLEPEQQPRYSKWPASLPQDTVYAFRSSQM